MNMRFLIPAVFAVATLSAAKVEAQVGCLNNDVLFGGVAATICYGSWIGNDVPNNQDAIRGWFNSNVPGDWGVLAKSDIPGDTFFNDADGVGSTGTFTLNDPISGTFGLSIMEGRFYSAYLWTNAGSSNRFDFETPNGEGLSHATLWDTEGEFITIVPEPSSFAMMFLGLAGLGVAARRRRNV